MTYTHFTLKALLNEAALFPIDGLFAQQDVVNFSGADVGTVARRDKFLCFLLQGDLTCNAFNRMITDGLY